MTTNPYLAWAEYPVYKMAFHRHLERKARMHALLYIYNNAISTATPSIPYLRRRRRKITFKSAVPYTKYVQMLGRAKRNPTP